MDLRSELEVEVAPASELPAGVEELHLCPLRLAVNTAGIHCRMAALHLCTAGKSR